MSNVTCIGILANPDVSGIGIRVNLYITMLLLAIIPEAEFTEPLLEVLVGNAGISGLSLLVTALVETAKKQLSLYHAIFIIHMLYFTGIMVVPSGKYEGNKINFTFRILISFVMTYGSVMLFTGYAFYVWATAPTFGTNPECNNEIKYIFFFVSVRATVGWLRKLWMVGLGATLGLMVLVPLASCLCLCFLGSAGGGGRSSLRKNTVKYSKPLAAIYGVVMLELYENRNKHLVAGGEDQWTFGQIMALVQIISTFNEMLHFVISLFSRSDEDDGGFGDAAHFEDSGSTNSTPGRARLHFFRRRGLKDNDEQGNGLELQRARQTQAYSI
ncbi:hypothetical protein F5887DRAFT_385657 [Amanita rubescens]|nr:hypothetical protein F5887DRAFT_385657 [Amanita rubescens]